MTSRRILYLGVGVATFAASTLLGATGAAAAADTPTALDATAITQVTPLGARVTGLAVRFDRPLDLAESEIDVSAFDVDATLTRDGAAPRTGQRTVVRAYSNSTVDLDPHHEAGNYLILELAATDPVASYSWSRGGFNQYYDLNGSLTYQQTGEIATPDLTLPARPGISITNTAVRNLVVDDYENLSLAAASGVNIPYRFYAPELEEGERVPLVLTLHGHGESGTDNASQILGNQISVAFTDPARQAQNKAFVLSPQTAEAAPGGIENGWWAPRWQQAVIELVEKTIAENPAIDPDRIYLTGLSMGSYGSWALLQQHSDLFTAAVLVCGAGDEAAAVAELGDFPIWALHSADDFVVRYDVPNSDYRIFKALEAAGSPVTWSQWPGNASQAEQLAYATDARHRANVAGSKHIFTTFPAGTTPVMSHFSWVPTYTNDVVVDWLFAQGTEESPTGSSAEIEVTVSTGDAGGLALRVAANQVDLGEATLNPELTALTASGDLPAITVADTRGENPGWSLTATSRDFIGDDEETTIDGKYLGLTPSLEQSAPTQLVSVGGAVPAGVGFTGGATLGSAPAGGGLGTAVFSGGLDLKAPTGTPGGLVLKSVIDITLF